MTAACRALRPHSRTLGSVQELITRNVKSHAGDLNRKSAAAFTGNFRTIDDLPGPSLSTTVYWLFVKGYADKSHAMQVGSYYFSRYCCCYRTAAVTATATRGRRKTLFHGGPAIMDPQLNLKFV